MTSHTNDLKQQIEHILHWEQSSHWRLRDFESLSHLVFLHTNRQLDARELQAFWTSSAVPSQSFLDTLARYADYADWNEFCIRNFYGEVDLGDEAVALHAPMWEIPIKWVILLCWLSLVVSVLVAILLVWKH
ncbi:hypothetical protein [Spirosoma radiotolerans]|uniref:Uncharacterized protein n=1 Tax=Spirosoma radiotolerans TaxID=1379870 RepID=A0A0E3ZZC1_9BACT|nr:hypothetical protein [Spirosoma radiotolerans]AKD58138.1 hypothetical protein SD10_27800 [Spirosoma radiotolerans]